MYDEYGQTPNLVGNSKGRASGGGKEQGRKSDRDKDRDGAIDSIPEASAREFGPAREPQEMRRHSGTGPVRAVRTGSNYSNGGNANGAGAANNRDRDRDTFDRERDDMDREQQRRYSNVSGNSYAPSQPSRYAESGF